MKLLNNTEEMIFRLRRDFYESAISPREISIRGNVLKLVLSGKNGQSGCRHMLRIEPVESVSWTFPHSTIHELYDSRISLLVTNIWLVTRYIENRDYEILIDGFPEWGLRIKMVQNRPLLVSVKKMPDVKSVRTSVKAKIKRKNKGAVVDGKSTQRKKSK